MSSGELVNVEPLELKFPFELKRQISCTLQVTNKSDNHVAFKVKTTNPNKYCVRPNTGIVLPNITSEIVVTMQAQKEAPPGMQCKDKFLLQSAVVSSGVDAKDITSEMFNKEQGQVEECKLRVIYVAPTQPPSPVAEVSEEDSEDGTKSSRSFVDSHDKSPEARSLLSKLTAERDAAIQQSNKLRQDLRESQRNRGGVSITFIIIVGFLGMLLGYIMKRT